MTSEFDRVIDRLPTESLKWHQYGEDVLPLWVADMDFSCPAPVLQALQDRVAHGILGYPKEPPELRAVLVDWLRHWYNWTVQPEAIVFLPGVAVGFNLAIHSTTRQGDGVLAQTPVYSPILRAPANAGCHREETELSRWSDGCYSVDMDAFEAAIAPRTRTFILCNPHNPVGRVFRREELEAMAQVCLRHNLIICSDEIHCDLLFDGRRHVPIASLDPEVGRRTITLMAPSKTFNVAGLYAAFAVIESRELRDRFTGARAGLVPEPSVLGYTGMLAAYRDGGPWLEKLRDYLQGNRDFLCQALDERLPGVSVCRPEGTYLAWLDCRSARLPPNPKRFFLERARVALSGGASFGRGGEGFVRLNFGCPRSTLQQALDRMATALKDTV